MLNYETFGEDKTKKPIIIAHGLFGSLKNWRAIAKALADNGRFAVTVDLRNHGCSFWSEDQSYKQMASDLKELVNVFGGSADIIGHSMGGKVGMSLALMSPKHITKLIVVDISPVKYSHNQLKPLEAMAGLNLVEIKFRKDAEEQLRKNIPELGERLFLVQNLNFRDKENIKWDINLEAIRNNLPNLMDFPHFKKPTYLSTLFIKGSLSNYITEEHTQKTHQLFPNYKLTTVEGAGHWIHVEKREEFINVILKFLC